MFVLVVEGTVIYFSLVVSGVGRNRKQNTYNLNLFVPETLRSDNGFRKTLLLGVVFLRRPKAPTAWHTL